MTLQVPEGFFDRCWDGSDGQRFQPTSDELPSHGAGGRRTIPPFDLLVSSNWGPADLAVGPRVELSVVLDRTPVGQILASVVVASQAVSVAVGRGVAPDVFVRFDASELLDVRAGRMPFLGLFLSEGAVLDGDDAVLLYLAGLFDDQLWSGRWGVTSEDEAAAAAFSAPTGLGAE
jgi:hypothetical protein